MDSIQKAAATADFKLRANVAGTSSPIAQCPDIISVTTQSTDPQADFGNPTSWATAYHAEAVPNVYNYVYVRGVNLGAETLRPQANLFAAAAQLIPWPSNWKTGVLTIAGGSDVTYFNPVEASAIGVTPQPFQWVPQALTKPGRFYGFYAWACDSAAAQPVPSAATLAEMAALLASQPGLGVSQVTLLDANQTSWVVRVGLSIPSTASDDNGPIMLTLGASGLNGATVGVIADVFNSQKQAVLMNPTPITDGNFVGINMTLEPGYNGVLTVQIWPGARKPSPGGALVATASYKPSGAKAAALAEIGALSSYAVHQAEAAGLADAKIGPTPSAVIGGFTALFK